MFPHLYIQPSIAFNLQQDPLGLLLVHECIYTGMVYCMDYVCANLDWLFERLQPLVKGKYSKSLLTVITEKSDHRHVITQRY